MIAASLPVVDPALAIVFGLGVLAGAHCLGMCGPLVTVYADRLGDERGVTFRELRQHGLFNAGRTLGYAVVGTLLGAVGGTVFDTVTLAPAGEWLRAGVGLLVGAAIVATGIGYLLGGSAGGHGFDLPIVGPAASRLVAALTARVDEWVAGPRIVVLGLGHAALPCPILYPAYLYAFSTGSALEGGLALAALGLGTFPTLFAYGTALGSLAPSTRAGLHRALGAGFVVLGTVPLAHALSLLGLSVPHVPLPHPTLP